MSKNKIIISIAVSIAWILLVLVPWQDLFINFFWLRFIAGFILFLVPGVLTFILLKGNHSNFEKWTLGGLVMSILGVGLLGLVARLLQLNFTWIRIGFMLWGFFAIFLFVRKDKKFDIRLESISWWEALVFLAAIGGAIFFASLAHPPFIHDDAFTYNALLYYYQHAEKLNFVFPDSLNRLEIPRFWIAYWPLVEAVISDLSKVDGLIITGSLLPPTLACFSFLGVYTLGRTLGLPRASAAIAVLAQGLSLMRLTRFNQPGNLFFQRLTEDKVIAAFVISLILFVFAVEYFEDPRPRNLIAIGLAALAMVFTHPIQFGMASMIIGVYGLPSLFKKEIRWQYVTMVGLLAAVILIPYSFRFSGGEYQQSLSFSLKDVAENDEFARFGVRRVDVIEGTRFYGISRYLTSGFPYEMGLVAAGVSLFFFWKHKIARFILAAFLVLGISMFPYTGWLVGFFTTPFQLWRLTWLMPFGLAFAFIAWVGFEIVQRIGFLQKWRLLVQPAFYLSLSALLVAGIIYLSPWADGNLPPTNLDLVDIYSNYKNMGEFMNGMDVNAPVIVGGPDAATNSILPSLTLKFMPLVFRVESGGEQTQLWKSLMGENIPPAERLARFQENKIEYILLRGDPEWMAQLISMYPDRFSLQFVDRRLQLYRVNQ